ncbi:MAG: hypothetical protein JW894_00720 [Bacteroidales bacterium]|nr:hypothetical protein [Bacteroidales bacterium]
MKALNKNTRTLFRTVTLVLICAFTLQVSAMVPERNLDKSNSEEISDGAVIEPWMINTSAWGNSEFYKLTNAVDFELEIQIEEWMLNINDNFWKADSEDEIEFEKWMVSTSSEHWNISDKEEEIELENWMTDLSEWDVK